MTLAEEITIVVPAKAVPDLVGSGREPGPIATSAPAFASGSVVMGPRLRGDDGERRAR